MGELLIRENSPLEDLYEELALAEAVFTNPNRARFFLGTDFFARAKNLKVVCTASTGTNHIDVAQASQKGIEVISLRSEKALLEKIPSTAELALALSLAMIRHIVPASSSVAKGNWDYLPFIGRQFSEMTVGVVGLGRLGTAYARLVRPLAKRVVYFDPFVDSQGYPERMSSLESLFEVADLVSLHVHPGSETTNMVNSKVLGFAKPNVVLINTSRGELFEEQEVVDFLLKNAHARVGTDVLVDEVRNRQDSPILRHSRVSDQVLVTPHIGGMTLEGQTLAFQTAAQNMVRALSSQAH